MTITRPYIAPTQRRTNPLPTDGTTLHAIGDVHTGSIAPWRTDMVSRDVIHGYLPNVDHVVQLGDCVDNQPTLMPTFTSFMDRVSAGVAWHTVMGNHDIDHDVQTPAQWASSLGLPSQSYVVDLPHLRMIFFSPMVNWSTYYQASAASLTWLDAQLGGTTNPCFVFAHLPLYGSVMGDANDFTSIENQFFLIGPNSGASEITDVLAAHSNFKAWINGHTHSRFDAPDFVKPMMAGSVAFAAINTSCIWYVTKLAPTTGLHRLHTPYITWRGDSIDVRLRDHIAGQWSAPNGRAVLTVAGLG